MITLITAVPGSGKTLYAITLIEKALKSGRIVYTNIEGIQHDRFTNSKNLLPAPDDWRDTPHGSLVVYDECQQSHLYPSNAQRGLVTDERLTAMETHRHSGHDLVFITQAPTFVHHHIRKLVGEHIHLYRGRGLKGAMRYEWSHTCDNPNDRKEQERANSEFWVFPSEYFGFYKSATIHTHSFKIPKKLAVFLFFLLAAVLYFAFRLFDAGGLKSVGDAVPRGSVGAGAGQSRPATAAPPSANVSSFDDLASASVIEPLAGCVSSNVRLHCSCYRPDGSPIGISTERCFQLMESPLPLSITVDSKNK